MQLTSKGKNPMIVEFRPHNILSDKFVYTLKFKGEAQSVRLMSRRDMIRTVNSRIEDNAYQVTDFLTEPQQYMPACCWFMSLIKHYLFNKMTEMQDKIIDRDALQDNLINQILDDMDIKTMMAILYDNMSNNYDSYTVDELIEEVEEYYPHLLED